MKLNFSFIGRVITTVDKATMAKSLKARSLGPRGLGAGLGAWGAKGPRSYVLGNATLYIIY